MKGEKSGVLFMGYHVFLPLALFWGFNGIFMGFHGYIYYIYIYIYIYLFDNYDSPTHQLEIII